ncbi:hypothetical protein LIA77_03939 [Sarocladium implicatum]|nr:hypothetical protein LIA77_03939 [Sarocladium implicatum]
MMLSSQWAVKFDQNAESTEQCVRLWSENAGRVIVIDVIDGFPVRYLHGNGRAGGENSWQLSRVGADPCEGRRETPGHPLRPPCDVAGGLREQTLQAAIEFGLGTKAREFSILLSID